MKRILLLLSIIIIGFYRADAQSACIGTQSMTVTPAPAANNTYLVGTTVTFCYSLTNYAQTSADWIAGFAITLGPGWDASTLASLNAPTSCDGQGVWGFYNSCSATASGSNWGPGFYYDSPSGSPNFVADGIPGNNFGDNCTSNTWTFCFTVQVGPCAGSTGAPLSVGIQALSDFQAGSWGSNACYDPPFTAPVQWNGATPTAQCNCALIIPNITVVDVTCANQNNGSVTVFPQGTAPYSYQWSNGASTQSITNLSPGIYTCTVTDSTLCSKIVTVPVGSLPVINITETVVDNLCSNGAGSISLVTTGGSGSNYTYSWSNGSTSSSLSNLNGGTYTVTVTDGNNCTQSETYNISTISPLTVSAGSNQNICQNSSANIAASPGGGTSPYTYLWSNGATGASQTVSPQSTTAYTVTVTDANGCTSGSTVTVDVTPVPVCQVSPNVSICQQGSTTLTASGGTNYSWSPSTGLSSNNTASTVASPSATTTYTVTASNGQCSSNATVTVTVAPPVNPQITATDTLLCSQGSTTLNATGGGTYSWSPSSGLSDPNIANPVASPNSTTTYTVVATVGQCTGTTSITINVLPPVSAAFTPDPSTGIMPLTVNFANSSSNASNYTWSFGDTTGTSTDVNPSYIYVNPGDYTVILIAYNSEGCPDTASALIHVDNVSTIVVPNVFTPNGDNKNDVFAVTGKGIVSFNCKILNRWGREVYSWDGIDGSWNGKSSGGEDLPEGPYMYIINASGVDAKTYKLSGAVQMIRGGKN